MLIDKMPTYNGSRAPPPNERNSLSAYKPVTLFYYYCNCELLDLHREQQQQQQQAGRRLDLSA